MTDSKKSRNGNSEERRGDPANVNIGLSQEETRDSVRLLNEALANVSIATIKTKKFHWDVVGPQFRTLHALFDEQYETLGEYADKIAERVRMLGGFPLGTAAGFLETAEVQEEPGNVPNATVAVQRLLADHEQIVRALRRGIDAAQDECHDSGTADLFTEMLRGHEEMAWMLRSFIQGEAVEADGKRHQSNVPAYA
jgi:starvation-inducible DNA-binding protein